MEKNDEMKLDVRLNILRAGVLGANDGVVSVAGVVIGVAAATTDLPTIIVAGLAAILAGAFSMAGGEYVSVSTQSDTEKAAIEQQKKLLETNFDQECLGVQKFYEEQGVSPDLAKQVADDIMSRKPLEITIWQKFGLEVGEYTNPWHAAFSSFLSFTGGSILPFAAVSLSPANQRVPVTVVAVVIALFITGYTSARLGKAPTRPAVLRNVLVGLLTMAVTYFIGQFFSI